LPISSLSVIKETKKRNGAILAFSGEVEYGENKSYGEFHIVIDGSLSNSSKQVLFGRKLLDFLKVEDADIKIF
jgi:hypothetical protein